MIICNCKGLYVFDLLLLFVLDKNKATFSWFDRTWKEYVDLYEIPCWSKLHWNILLELCKFLFLVHLQNLPEFFHWVFRWLICIYCSLDHSNNTFCCQATTILNVKTHFCFVVFLVCVLQQVLGRKLSVAFTVKACTKSSERSRLYTSRFFATRNIFQLFPAQG